MRKVAWLWAGRVNSDARMVDEADRVATAYAHLLVDCRGVDWEQAVRHVEAVAAGTEPSHDMLQVT